MSSGTLAIALAVWEFLGYDIKLLAVSTLQQSAPPLCLRPSQIVSFVKLRQIIVLP